MKSDRYGVGGGANFHLVEGMAEEVVGCRALMLLQRVTLKPE